MPQPYADLSDSELWEQLQEKLNGKNSQKSLILRGGCCAMPKKNKDVPAKDNHHKIPGKTLQELKREAKIIERKTERDKKVFEKYLKAN